MYNSSVNTINFTYSPIASVDWSFSESCRKHLCTKCIPPYAMGQLENTAVRIACISHSLAPDLGTPYVIIAAGDHGVYEQGVSFAPQDVTWQHSINIAHGGGVCGLFARKYGLPLTVCDVGVKHDFSAADGIRNCKVVQGSKDLSREAAMSLDECRQALEHGRDMVAEISREGFKTLILGEMGIGNTTPASALTCALLGLSAEKCVGCGTGMSQKALANKREVVSLGVARCARENDPLRLLAELGGYELAFMTGAMLEAAGRGMILILDGFIVSASALVAHAVDARVSDHMIASHCSNEPGHAMQLQHLGLEPLLRVGMCLGEGSGAIIAWPLVEASVALLTELNSFAEGGLDNASDAILGAKAKDEGV